MSLRLLTDVHVRIEVTEGLRTRGVDVLTAQEDGSERLADPALLDRATELGRVLFSQDRDLLCEAALRQRTGVEFAGLVYGHQLRVTIGGAIDDLHLLAEICVPEDYWNQVIYLPLR